MKIKYKLYPYPVLCNLENFENGYKTSEYKFEIKTEKKQHNIIIKYKASLNCSSLKKLIENDLADYIIHLECPQTGFRTAIRSKNSEDVITLSEVDLNGELQICSFIAAIKPISDYSSENFIEDYNGINFNIDASCILAIGQSYTVYIEKNTQTPKDIPSIFSITKDLDNKSKEMTADWYNSDKIIIKLPALEYNTYFQLRKNRQLLDILTCMTVVPVLAQVFEDIRKNNNINEDEVGEEDDLNFKNKTWYRALSRILPKFGIEINSRDIGNNPTCIELAQRVLLNPLTKALNKMAQQSESDDEE